MTLSTLRSNPNSGVWTPTTVSPASRVFRRPGADVRQRAQPVDAGVGPEVDEDDPSPESLGRQRLGVEPPGGAVEGGQATLDRQAAARPPGDGRSSGSGRARAPAASPCRIPGRRCASRRTWPLSLPDGAARKRHPSRPRTARAPAGWERSGRCWTSLPPDVYRSSAGRRARAGRRPAWRTCGPGSHPLTHWWWHQSSFPAPRGGRIRRALVAGPREQHLSGRSTSRCLRKNQGLSRVPAVAAAVRLDPAADPWLIAGLDRPGRGGDRGRDGVRGGRRQP